MVRQLASAVVIALLLSTTAPAGARSDPSLKDVLSRAAEWVQRFADEAAYVVGEERYLQEYRSKDVRGATSVERRDLLSEIVLVRSRDEEVSAGYPWVQFRDVVEVDGTPLPEHRGRLERLLQQAGPSAYAQAAALIQESARFNIGPGVRTVNVPSFPLFFLNARNQSRFRFELNKQQSSPTVAVVAYRERQRPTMIVSPRHEDLPSSGAFWIEPASGRVEKTQLQVRVAQHWKMTTEVEYSYDAGVEAWVPRTMREHFAGNDETLDASASYSNYKRFRTSGRLIVK